MTSEERKVYKAIRSERVKEFFAEETVYGYAEGVRTDTGRLDLIFWVKSHNETTSEELNSLRDRFGAELVRFRAELVDDDPYGVNSTDGEFIIVGAQP